MKFGLVYPNQGSYCNKDLAVKAIQEAEAHGFDSFLIWDHYMMPGGNKMFEAWILLSHLASQTSTIRLGTCVTPIPLRPPGILAKMVSTLDLLSNGRVIFGVGAGWHRPEFEAYSIWEPSNIRVAKTKEGLELMISLWTQDEVNFKGRFYTARNANLDPKPVQKPYPPLWFGSFGDYMLRLTAKFGRGWIPTGISLSQYRNSVRKLMEGVEQMGRRSREITYAYVNDAIEDSEKIVKSVEDYREAGCKYYTIAWAYSREKFLNQIRRFSEEVIPSFT